MAETAGIWSDVAIAGHQCHAYEPAATSPHGFTVVYLHGHAVEPLSNHSRFAGLFDQFGLRCLAPMTGPSWWTDRIWGGFDAEVSPERYVLDRVLPWLRDHWQVEPPRIALLGTSMGGQGALRLSYKHPSLFPVVAAIAPAIDYQSCLDEGDPALRALYRDAEQARQDTATLHIHPLNWPRHQWFCCDPQDERWFDSADRLRMKLYSLGVPHECSLETTGGGHSWRYFERMAAASIEFVADRLERERLRVV